MRAVIEAGKVKHFVRTRCECGGGLSDLNILAPCECDSFREDLCVKRFDTPIKADEDYQPKCTCGCHRPRVHTGIFHCTKNCGNAIKESELIVRI